MFLVIRLVIGVLGLLYSGGQALRLMENLGASPDAAGNPYRDSAIGAGIASIAIGLVVALVAFKGTGKKRDAESDDTPTHRPPTPETGESATDRPWF